MNVVTQSLIIFIIKWFNLIDIDCQSLLFTVDNC